MREGQKRTPDPDKCHEACGGLLIFTIGNFVSKQQVDRAAQKLIEATRRKYGRKWWRETEAIAQAVRRRHT